MNIRIGNQTAFTAGSLLEPFEFALDQRFEAFEFFPDRGPNGDRGWDERGVGSDQREYIRRAADACGLTLTVHTPLVFSPLDNPSDDRLFSTVEFAQDVGAILVNLHLDIHQGVDAFCRALEPTLKAAQAVGLRVAIENSVWTGPDDFNVFFERLREIYPKFADGVGMCFDLGHANACSQTCNDYLGFMDQLDSSMPIIHTHLHENHGDRDSHLPLFTGPAMLNPAGIVGLLERLRARNFDGCAILEQWPQPVQLLVDARDRLVELVGQTN